MDLVLSRDQPPAIADPLEAGIVPAPRQKTYYFGISQVGQLYAYGDTPATPARVIEESSGVAFVSILDCSVTQRANRDYLEIRLQSPVPDTIYVIALPCQGSVKADGTVSTQWSVRSLLGALTASGLDLQDRAGIVSARRGSGGDSGYKANFVDLFLEAATHGSELKPIYADAIGGDRNDLEIAVNQVRRSLDLEPQFL